MDPRPFHNGYGINTVIGVPKPAYRAFEILHQVRACCGLALTERTTCN
jgi:hypothetical protein